MRTRVYHRMLRLFFLLGVAASIGIHLTSAQWVQQTSDTPENLVDVVVLDSMKALAIGDRNGILRTTDAGSTWINESAAISAIYRWNSLSFFGPLNGMIVGDHRIVTTTDGGITWKLLTLPSTQKCLSVLCLGPGSFYVGADSGWVYNTSDTGKTWTSEKISEWPIRSLFIWRGIELALFGVSRYALTSHSICTQYVIPPPSWSESILTSFQGLGSEAFDAEFCNGGGAGFIVGVQGDLRSAPTILRKAMSDTAWLEVSTGILRDGTLLGVSAPSANVIYVCGSNGMIFKSSNGGDTWIDQTVQTTRNVNAIFFYDEKHGFAVGDSGTILFTANGGSPSVNAPPQPFHLQWPTNGDTMTIMRSITFVWQKAIDPDNDSVRYSLLISSDHGASWTVHGPTTDTMLQVHSPAQTPGPYFWMVIATDSDLATPSLDVFKFTIISPTNAEEKSAPNTFAVYQNYPNPFNPSTTITFSVGTYSHTSLRVYDVLGREVASLVNEKKAPGTYTQQWNAKGIPSGIYFYQLQAGSFTMTKKLVLLR